MIEELAGAWTNRDWMSMFFVWRARLQEMHRENIISAIHHDEGNFKYEEFHSVPFNSVILAFPQLYTLFWQYL